MDSQYQPDNCLRCQTVLMTSDSNGNLGALLHSWRDRRSPIDVGLPTGDGRRAIGLRREELAALAGVSVDYLVRLEQGRAKRPSSQVAASLARALQLSDTERDHLYMLAGLLAPSPGDVPRHIPPGVQRLVTRLGETPIAVFTASWDLLTWSPLWGALIGEPLMSGPLRPNLLRTHFLGAGFGRSDFLLVSRTGKVEKFEASLVSDLRRVHGLYPDDRSVATLVRDLSASDRFRELWESGDVSEHESELKVVHNDLVGDIEVDCDVFTVAGTDLRIVAYTAAEGSEAAEKLDFLRVSAVRAASVAAEL